ncbi:polysaccharide ABC transporter ATP-binding protein [Kitasatospora cheerisanensis]|uniref:Putative polysaccharide ABC transporter ATP-binding protein n=1 Tax=Kitasatospora cheerisanensis KCTC 2395 TaxID=1348663 RepID=A0A066Z2V6_9ACTN|nr:polysaccharide ABC transporter ATP-binding protein [Kitasatospora cheerisanensis]KDN86574.1 putative polysaccharide ABC transporter ATP-binding protein [Kitasatospora cheerisanensis KCTC 2395]
MSRDYPLGTIRTEQVWKRFRADQQRMLLRDRVEQAARRLRGDRGEDWRWALRDINLHIEPGESVGLIGSNGSGKSTLLKMLTRVMYPYAGIIDVRGRIGALIEIRAGIHPDLTGRENIYLFGALLGLKRREVAGRFDDIVEFARLGGAIDRQVKFYSSGMQMRLGFAVAAYLEPHVLLVDEVLAVGDAVFQQRCLDRMREVAEQGTTIVFVSHDLPAVQSICRRGVWLEQGTVRVDAGIKDALAGYRDSIEAQSEATARVGEPLSLLTYEVRGETGEETLHTDEPVTVELTLGGDYRGDATLHLGVSEGTSSPIFQISHEIRMTGGDHRVACVIPRLPLPRGRYTLWAGVYSIGKTDGGTLMSWHSAGQFDVFGPMLDTPPRAVVLAAPVFVPHQWEE